MAVIEGNILLQERLEELVSEVVCHALPHPSQECDIREGEHCLVNTTKY